MGASRSNTCLELLNYFDVTCLFFGALVLISNLRMRQPQQHALHAALVAALVSHALSVHRLFVNQLLRHLTRAPGTASDELQPLATALGTDRHMDTAVAEITKPAASALCSSIKLQRAEHNELPPQTKPHDVGVLEPCPSRRSRASQMEHRTCKTSNRPESQVRLPAISHTTEAS